MARKRHVSSNDFVLFNVIYEDGSLSSNRKVPATMLEGLDGDAPAKDIIEEQDRKVAELSGRPRGKIKSVARVSGR